MKRRLLASTLLGFLLLLPLLGASDPPARFSFSSYGSSQGLGNLAIRVIHQDAEGFLWVGTEDGLFRFDGVQFKGFGQAEGLPSSYIDALAVDAQGHLWVATYAGLTVLENGRFKPFPLPSGVTRAKAMVCDEQNRLWIATRQGLFVRENGQDFQAARNWGEGAAQALSLDAHGDLWVAAGSRVLKQGTHDSWQVVTQTGGETIRYLLASPTKELWVIGERGAWRWSEEHPALMAMDENLKLGRPISAPVLDRMGRVWLPRAGGASCFEKGQWRTLNRSNGLPSSTTEVMFVDREGNLWFGATGLHRLLGQGALEAITSLEGLPDDTVRGVWRENGLLMVGTDEGLATWDGLHWKAVPGTSGHSIRTLCADSRGNRYLAGTPSEVLQWPLGGKPSVLPLPPRQLGTGRIFKLCWFEDQLWVGTENAGLLRLKRDGRTWNAEHIALPQGTPQERFSDLVVDRSGALWACGEKGLAIRSKDGTWRRFTSRDGLRRDHVAYLCQRRDNEYAVAYFDAVGFTRFRIEQEKFQILAHVDRKSGLRSDKVYTLVEDRRKQLWVGTGLGLTVFRDTSNQSDHEDYTTERGLASEDCNAQAFLEDATGDIWVGTSGGLAHLRSSKLRGLPPPPHTQILEASFGERPLGLDNASHTVTRLPDNTLTIHFAGLGYATSGHLEHQVRLLGLESGWQPTTAHEARFPALRPGRYRFEVRSRYPGCEWGSQDSLDFTVEPRIWQRTWFWVVLGGILASLIAVAVKWRIDHLHLQSISDPLTGLKNRRSLREGFQKEVEQLIRRCSRLNGTRSGDMPTNQDLVFFLVDIDHFKAVNDTYGHAAGDHVLKQLAQLLLKASRGSDTAIRWGGEEFLLIARHADRRQASIVAERIRAFVANHPFDIGDTTLRMTCSIGFCPFPFQHSDPENITWEATVELADQCMYAAKRSGRNLWVGIQPKRKGPLPRHGDEHTYALPAWLEDGLVEIQTNHPEPTRMTWDLVGTL